MSSRCPSVLGVWRGLDFRGPAVCMGGCKTRPPPPRRPSSDPTTLQARLGLCKAWDPPCPVPTMLSGKHRGLRLCSEDVSSLQHRWLKRPGVLLVLCHCVCRLVCPHGTPSAESRNGSPPLPSWTPPPPHVPPASDLHDLCGLGSPPLAAPPRSPADRMPPTGPSIS